MSSKKIGLAIIGTGMAAKPHALALNELKDDINVVGVFSRNKEKRENFSKNCNFNSFQDIDSIYDNPEVDMVDIITPPNQRNFSHLKAEAGPENLDPPPKKQHRLAPGQKPKIKHQIVNYL